MTTTTDLRIEFQSALVAAERSTQISEADDLYGCLVGSWELDVLHYRVDVREKRLKGEAHFAWALEGRAVQDVWIMPPRSERTDETDPACNMYGTTLRVWDPTIKAWRITWTNPVTGQCDRLVGRRQGKDLVQIGTHADGTPICWRFTDITPDSFRWIGEALNPDGKTWRIEAEFHAKRVR